MQPSGRVKGRRWHRGRWPAGGRLALVNEAWCLRSVLAKAAGEEKRRFLSSLSTKVAAVRSWSSRAAWSRALV